MPRPPKAKEPIKQAALQLFVENGVHATGIREIAKQAGCSEAALYRHWRNKDQLVIDLYQEHLVNVVALIDQDDPDAPTEQRIHDMVDRLYQLYDSEPLVFRYVLLIQHDMIRQVPTDLRRPQDAIQELVASIMGRAESHQSVVLSTAALVGVFLETASYVLYDRLPGPISRYADDVAERCRCLLETMN